MKSTNRLNCIITLNNIERIRFLGRSFQLSLTGRSGRSFWTRSSENEPDYLYYKRYMYLYTYISCTYNQSHTFKSRVFVVVIIANNNSLTHTTLHDLRFSLLFLVHLSKCVYKGLWRVNGFKTIFSFVIFTIFMIHILFLEN